MDVGDREWFCNPACDVEVSMGLDCHECGHSLECIFCCTNNEGEAIEEERAVQTVIYKHDKVEKW